uniref:Uncharacterized protein n=1 Tax=Panagrolaimus sp. ES5 TaxID=591445 RepID=A0AC34FS73_9BILA
MDLPVSERITKNVIQNGSKTATSITQTSFLSSYRNQSFSLPDSIMFYMAKNPPSAEIYQKLIQSCKYFFVKNPLLVASKLWFHCDDAGQWQTLINKKVVDFNSVAAKTWVTDEVVVNVDWSEEEFRGENRHNVLSDFMQHIYRCDAKKLSLCEQNISFKDFVFLASKCEEISLGAIVDKAVDETSIAAIRDEEGTVVPLETLFEAIPFVKDFSYFFGYTGFGISSDTVKKLVKIPHFLNLTELYFQFLPDCFDIDTFFTYIKQNKKTMINLTFSDEMFETHRLKSIVREIIQAENHPYRPPYIHFPDMSRSFYNKLCELFY